MAAQLYAFLGRSDWSKAAFKVDESGVTRVRGASPEALVYAPESGSIRTPGSGLIVLTVSDPRGRREWYFTNARLLNANIDSVKAGKPFATIQEGPNGPLALGVELGVDLGQGLNSKDPIEALTRLKALFPGTDGVRLGEIAQDGTVAATPPVAAPVASLAGPNAAPLPGGAPMGPAGAWGAVPSPETALALQQGGALAAPPTDKGRVALYALGAAGLLLVVYGLTAGSSKRGGR